MCIMVFIMLLFLSVLSLVWSFCALLIVLRATWLSLQIVTFVLTRIVISAVTIAASSAHVENGYSETCPWNLISSVPSMCHSKPIV